MSDDPEDGPEYKLGPVTPEVTPKSVAEVFARKKRRQQSVKAANQMWAPILEHYREYSAQLVFVPWRET